VLDTLHPAFHLDLKFRSKTKFGQVHDFEDAIPFKLQMSQLGTTLSSWATEMHLSDKNPLCMLAISQSHQEDDLDQPNIYDIAADLTCALCGRSGHESSRCHKFMNHVIGYALSNAHPKETSRIMREHKKFITVGPRGTPRYEERTKLPSSSIRAVMPSEPSGNNTLSHCEKTLSPQEAQFFSFDHTLQITRIGGNGTHSFGSVESDGLLDYEPTTCITVCHDVSMGMRYDVQTINRINANWDDELFSATYPSISSPATPPTEVMYEHDEMEKFYNTCDAQVKDLPTTSEL
jgi:hypothetical protein